MGFSNIGKHKYSWVLNIIRCVYLNVNRWYLNKIKCDKKSTLRALALENSNAILFYHSKIPLYQYTILFYNTSTSQNSIFIKILFFNPFFIISFQPFSLIFLGFSTAIFISLPAPVQHTTNTHYTPINLSKPITTPTHTNTNTTQQQSHTQTQPSNKAKPHTQTQTHSKTGPPIKNPGQATNPHRRSIDPRHRFETQATDQKSEQTHSKKIITEANPFKKHHH